MSHGTRALFQTFIRSTLVLGRASKKKPRHSATPHLVPVEQTQAQKQYLSTISAASYSYTVIEGLLFDIYMGKPIAFVGHTVTCPKCKGIFPIVEGAPNMTFYGKGVALAGMQTACGATLISTQFTGTVEYGRGSVPAGAVKPGNQAAQTSLIAAILESATSSSTTSSY